MAGLKIEDLPAFVVHDPELAHQIHDLLITEIGARSKQYRKFLQLTRMLADAVGVRFVNPYDGKRKNIVISVKVPRTLANRLTEIARELGVTRSELIRLALSTLVMAWERGDGK